MAKNGKDTKHTRNIARRMNFVRNGEKCNMHKIDWCEGGLQLAEIDTKNSGEHDLTPRIKIYYGKTSQLIQKSCSIEYPVFCQPSCTSVLYQL